MRCACYVTVQEDEMSFCWKNDKGYLPADSNADFSRRQAWIFLAVILVFAAVVRLWGLGHASYMIDEINMVRDSVDKSSIGEVIRQDWGRFTWYHRIPLLSVLLYFFVEAPAGGGFPSEVAARLPFALIGTATILLAYWMGALIKNRKLGVWCALLYAISVYHVYYSKEAYDYSLVIAVATGTLAAGGLLFKRLIKNVRISWSAAAGYILFSMLLIYSHLACLMFLFLFCALLTLFAGASLYKRKELSVKLAVQWCAVMAVAFISFLPFIFKLLAQGFQVTEYGVYSRATWHTIPAVLGRMGWGEHWVLLTVFVTLVLMGAVAGWRSKDPVARMMPLLLVLYAVVQTWMLRVSRFEVRYYSALFPVLMLLAGQGILWISGMMSRRKILRLGLFEAVFAIALIAWMAPSLYSLCVMKCRGNYKYIAKWINENLPDNGIYVYDNVYELRGVPSVYPTHGRFPSYPVAWTGDEQYRQLKVRDRLISFFTRFPLAVFIEPAPADLVAGLEFCENKPLPRDALFVRSEMLQDVDFQRLVKLCTLPTGTAQWANSAIDRVLISYNRPEDLPELARRNGKSFYHYFGPAWQYYKDTRNMSDWRVIQGRGFVMLGSLPEHPVTVDIEVTAWMPQGDGACRVEIPGTEKPQFVNIGAQPKRILLENAVLQPGENRLYLTSSTGALLVYDVEIREKAEKGK